MASTAKKILVACEYSDTVSSAFRECGHDVTSCDLLPSEGPPEFHVQGDVTPLLQKPWDLVIAHPPCTYLCNSGVRWLHEREGRWELMFAAANVFKQCLNANAPRVAVENPTMHRYAREAVGRGPDCAVQPFQFGNMESKRTAFWLKGLPPLLPTHAGAPLRASVHREPPGPERAKNRSRTFPGMAAAMAKQWG